MAYDKFSKDRKNDREIGGKREASDKYNRRNDRENDSENRSDRQNEPRTNLIIGRNAVKEALKAGRPADSLLIQRGELSGSIRPIIAECKEKGIIVKEVDSKKLDFMCGHAHHQGVIMIAAAHEYSTVENILKKAEEKGEAPFIIICDSLEDPHNLGAIIRTADAAGAHGVIIPERRSVSLSGIVGKTSAGALEYVPVARVKNITSVIKLLKEKGLWVYCADMDGTPYRKADLSGAIALVVGGEGAGVSRLVKENCDGVLSIPMRGNVNSLNASVAAAILIFEAAHTRN
ncbi:MAG: 23S rRNA (guanosine(2251)-2'-O)-methyltransferase RlmB [Ruminococcaceae bacterium]|nr:23S rRNA (guanosine(2251)-2'-O)-methyltransferase RlmB [Oscillospiraceae bacterium]